MNRNLHSLAVTAFVVSAAVAQVNPAASQSQSPKYLHDLASRGNASALEELKVIANKGSLEASFEPSILYFAGEGVPNDLAQSEKWGRKAAEGGHAQAEANLGTLYAWGRGVPRDLVLAASWYRKAAEQGNVQGQLSLGTAYQNGSGVAKDLVTAYMWMDLAAQQGSKFTTPGTGGVLSYQARTARDEMAKQMSSAQIAEAQQRSRNWKLKPSVSRQP